MTQESRELAVPQTTDLDLTAKGVTELASPDAITAFLAKLGYDTADRTSLSPEAVGLSEESASGIKRIELLSEDPEKFLRVVFAQPKSLTAKARNDLVRVDGDDFVAKDEQADVAPGTRCFIKSEVGARAIADLMGWYERQWSDSVDFKDNLIELLDASKFGTKEYTPYEVYTKALYEYFKEELGENSPGLGRSAVDLAEFQDDAVKKARRILARYDGVLIADSVGLGKTWIGKKLLEDYAYHRRQKAVVVCPASLREMWQKELATATIAAQVVGMEDLGRPATFLK